MRGPDGHYYEVVLDEPLSWAEANVVANDRVFLGHAGHLVTITSGEEDKFTGRTKEQANAMQSRSTAEGEEFLISGDVPRGEYFLGILIDAFEQVDERDETNNTLVVAVQVSDGCDAGNEAGGAQLPGDTDQDARMDVSDVVALLGHLFLGNPQWLPCGDGTRDAATNRALLNANNDAAGVDLSDATYLLTYMFLGGAPHSLGEKCVRIVSCSDVQCRPR